ncbi:PLP-dependent aminotransferase family protein [Shimazuella kribbensis]|uniref:aminotransferase-like domain-containing protein n=1 Tax=Shimazuella kribbensis TaxID=139808 RepID=UPI000411CD47|nr:PLP-dependent aminotransferase family protein [Shimazuella kribbensis]
MSPVDNGNLLQKLLKKASSESLISFTAGFPANDMLPVEEIRKCYEKALKDHQILQYSTDSKGNRSLREEISKRLKHKHIIITSDNILVTTGSSQAIDLITRITAAKGDVVLVERPTYQEVLKSLHQQGIQAVGVQSDWEGMLPEDVEEKIRTFRPKFVYVNPTFGNPNGKVWSIERRKQLIQLCKAAGVLILEDDPYGDLRFQSMHIPSLYELDEASDHATVVYVSTFSKIIAPAVRVGYIAANPTILQSLVQLQHLSVIHSGTIDQQAISHYLQNYDLDKRNALLVKEYQSRLNEMEDELVVQLGNEVKWNKPTGGIYLWMEISPDIDSMQLLEDSLANGVSYFPGHFFYVDEPDVNGIRLNFTFTSKEKIRTGIRKLAQVYQEMKASV